MKALIVLALLAPAVARADRPVDKLLAENPRLALLVRTLSQAHLRLAGCNWFGKPDRAECTQRMTTAAVTQTLARIGASDVKTTCTSQPRTGFKCTMKTEMSTEMVELRCAARCVLHAHASNDDEDEDMRFDFLGNDIRFSYEHTN